MFKLARDAVISIFNGLEKKSTSDESNGIKPSKTNIRNNQEKRIYDMTKNVIIECFLEGNSGGGIFKQAKGISEVFKT